MGFTKLNDAVSMYDSFSLKSGDDNKHLMALSVDKSTLKDDCFYGLAREIYSREGDVQVPGYVDMSNLVLVKSHNLLEWTFENEIKIKNIEKVVEDIFINESFFLGLEDPDILVDENELKHVYYTMPFKAKSDRHTKYGIYLGYASGDSLTDLIAKDPVLSPVKDQKFGNLSGFKEICCSPIKNSKGFRINLAETGFSHEGIGVSAIAATEFQERGMKGRYLGIAFNPIERGIPWCNEHASPCFLFSKDFVNPGKDLIAGVMNGRSNSSYESGRRIYGNFNPGLFLYNPETGDIPWVDSKPLFEDPKAKTVTFASDFVQLNENEGYLYAHVDDSFVRTYKIDSSQINKLIERSE